MGCDVFFIKSENLIPRNRDRQRSTKIAVEGKIFAFVFSKKSDISFLSIECRVLDRCRAFDRLVSVDALPTSGVHPLLDAQWLSVCQNFLSMSCIKLSIRIKVRIS
jgi:hypothetical protein